MGSAEKHIQEKGGGGGGDEEEAEEEEETSDFGLLGSSEDDSRIIEWEDGLPSADDLMPLSQPLITPELASAFSISPEPYRSSFDVNRASQNTIANLRRHHSAPSRVLKSLPPFHPDPTDETDNSVSESRKVRRLDADEADDSTPNDDHSAARTLKRPRLVWTPQLHKRFVDVVHHLGIKNAVPKTIMQLMNVEGLTRENVASHLQKYRLYLKRMQGLSTDGPSSSDPLFASTPIPQSFHEAGSVGGGAPMQYGAAQTMPMPVLGMPQGHGHLGPMPEMGNHPGASAPNYHHGFVDSNPYNHMLIQQQQREWSGNQYGSIMSYNHMTSSNK